MKKVTTLCLIFLCFSAVLFAEQKRMAPLGFPSTAGNGMGGPHAAYTSDIYALFVNPAALQWANQASILELSPALMGPLDKLARSGSGLTDALKGKSGSGSNPFTSLANIIDGGKLSIGLDMRGPLSAGYTANGLGFGLFSRVFADVRVIGTDVDVTGYVDMMLPFGMSFNVVRLQDHELAAGFVLKPFVRAIIDKELSALDFVGGNGDISINVPILAGMGSDLGVLYRFKRDLALGLTLGDLYTFGGRMGNITGTSVDNEIYRVPLSLNLGAAYTFRLANFWEAAPRALQSAYIAAMADWRSMNNIFTWNDRLHRNPILDLGLGAEFGFFNFLKLRVGFRDMLPAIGLGLEPKVFKFNVALYGKELGSEPGINSTMALDISMALRLETKKRNWPWSKPFIK
ncbi:MAG: hypothetical protein LBG07_09340 [Treponema sp.]|nr:hypothetical protein [Treponema sp.]